MPPEGPGRSQRVKYSSTQVLEGRECASVHAWALPYWPGVQGPRRARALPVLYHCSAVWEIMPTCPRNC